MSSLISHLFRLLIARLGHRLAALTVWKILRDAGREPTPNRTGPSWSEFIANQAHALVATDFFCVDTVTMRRELIELATTAEPESVAAHGARAEIYMARRQVERSLMAKGIYATAARESTAIVESTLPNNPDETP